MSSLRVVAGAAVAIAAAVLMSGCGITRVLTPPEDTLAPWTDHPLAADPALAAEALSGHSACLMDGAVGQVRILLQDRRTSQTAAFLVATSTMLGTCIVTSGSGRSSGGGGPAPGAMAGPISIDSNAGGGSTNDQSRLLGGRVINTAAEVVVHLADGRSVVASLDNGYWLAWWPDTTFATSVSATDPGGASIGSVKVVE